MKKDTMFGDHRVSTILVQKDSRTRNDMLSEMAEWCAENTCLEGDNNLCTYSGIKEGEVVWCFDDEKDATLFALRWVK